MARGLHRRPHVDRLAALGGSILIITATLFWTIAAAGTALAADTSAFTASATVAPNEWTAPDNALNGSDDGAYATASANGLDQGYRSFGISLPAGSIVDGITVRIEALSSASNGCQLGVRLSGNAGSSFTARKTQPLTDVEQFVVFGGATDTWGQVWDGSQLSDTEFRVELRNIDPGTGCENGATTSVDRIDLTVTYRTINSGTQNPALSAEACDTADFNFVIDMSGSIGSQGLQQIKDGVTGFVDAFQAGGGDGRYSGTRFNATSASTLTAGYVSAASFSTKVDALASPAGNTPTAAGIDTGAANNGGDRAGAPNILFVLTDGSPNVPNTHHNDLTIPEAWLQGANAAITAADGARAGSGASQYVVKAVYLSRPGHPGDTNLPFSPAGDAAWAQAVMKNIGGGSFLDADFKDFAKDLFGAIHCAPPSPAVQVAKTATPTKIGEPGGTVSFSVDVHNLSLDPVTLDSLVDDVYGDLNGKGTCATGGTIAGGETYHCTFTGAVAGNAGATHTDTVTADVSNESGKASDSDSATVTIGDVLPTITVVKTANPDALPAVGGSATFQVIVTNTSPESVTISSIVDDVYGDLNGVGTCASGATLAAGASYTCSFSQTIPAVAGDHADVVTVVAVDDEKNPVNASDDAHVVVAGPGSTPTTPTPTPTPTPAPSGGVQGATGTPHITPPPTDVLPTDAPTDGRGLTATLASIVAFAGALLFLTRRRLRRERTRR